MDLSINNNHNKQNKECHSRTSFQSENTLYFSSTDYQSMSNAHSNFYLSATASDPLEFELSNVGMVDTTSNIKSPDIAFSSATTPNLYSTDYQTMSYADSNLYLLATASHSLKIEQSDVESVDTTSNIKSPDIAFSPATTPHFYSTNYQRMSNTHSNLELSETASHPLKFEQSDVEAVDTTSNIKPPDIAFSPATTPYFYSTNYQRMSNAHSNLNLSETASHPLKFEQSDVGVVDTTSNIKSVDIAFSPATTPYFYSTNYQRMSNAHSNLDLSETASHPLKFEQSDVGVVDTTSNIKSVDIAFSSATTSNFSSTNYQRIRAIKTTEKTSPFKSLFLPLTTSYSSSINNKGISPKVIEYVLECQKNTDQSFVHRKDANSFMCNTDEDNPVDLTYAAITKNNYKMLLEPPSIPNIQQISKPRRPNVLLKSNRALRRYIPTVLTSRLQPIEKKAFQESVHVYNFRQTNEQIESTTSNIKESDFRQSSYSTNQPFHSMDEEYSSNTFHSQLIPNPAFKTPKKKLIGKYYMDISMFPKLEALSDELNQSLILKTALEKPEKLAYRMCNPSSHNIPLTQFAPIGNSIKPGIPKLSAHEVGDELGICPVILHPSKQLSSQVQMKSEALIKTIGFAPARSQMTAQAQNRIVSTPLQRSIMESQNVSPLIITPTSHVIHSANEIVPAKIVPIPTAPAVSHFSVINKTGSYDSIPEYTGIRPSLVSGTPPVYTQSDFARFPPKSYHHKNAVVNPAVIHGPIPGNIDEPCINIPNSQHVFKPIISPRPSILRKRDADGVLRAQKNLIPILTKPDPDEGQNTDETSLNRNGFSETGLQLESIMVPQVPEVKLLPQISALTKQSHMMVEISPRKKPRKQLLPVNQENSPFKIVGDDMEYVDEKLIKSEKSEDFPDEDLNCNDDLIDGDAEDEAEDDLDDMDVDDDCPADDDYDDDDDDFGNDFGDEFDYVKSEKPFFEDVKPSVEVSDESSAKPKNKRPSLLAGYKNTWRAFQTHHFHRHADFKIKETKKQLADMQQSKKWMSDSISGWRIQHLIDQFDEMVIIEDDIIATMNQLKSEIEANIDDDRLCSNIIELIEDNIQRSKVSRAQLDDIRHQLKKIFDYKILIEDVVDKYCPKDLKKKYAKVFNLSKL
ncbi:uncharacterized protein LOC114124185 isoform X7 [Aphis gossypii]|uniref:uncharacterized protein LOC114124185 isoform X7 n=1 Tax=Aphis gossypii TaxID=80765 RepID=UPI00215990D3|nr:uncharacterized protein LOC114124185 isoform X7 [Aphis gossypii]